MEQIPAPPPTESSKPKLALVLVFLLTLALGGVAVFTATRLKKPEKVTEKPTKAAEKGVIGKCPLPQDCKGNQGVGDGCCGDPSKPTAGQPGAEVFCENGTCYGWRSHTYCQVKNGNSPDWSCNTNCQCEKKPGPWVGSSEICCAGDEKNQSPTAPNACAKLYFETTANGKRLKLNKGTLGSDAQICHCDKRDTACETNCQKTTYLEGEDCGTWQGDGTVTYCGASSRLVLVYTAPTDCGGAKTHKECNASKACVSVAGAGENKCQSDADCVSPVNPVCNSLSATPTSGSAPTTVSFSTTATDPSKRITSYKFAFGDGNTEEKTTGTTTHTYSTNGTFTAKVNLKYNSTWTADKTECTKTITLSSAPTHTSCTSDKKCQTVAGAGTNQCSADADCRELSHTVCTADQRCISVSGAGTAECETNADCRVGGPSTPPTTPSAPPPVPETGNPMTNLVVLLGSLVAVVGGLIGLKRLDPLFRKFENRLTK